jgi:PAS domain S-box-containing protein
MKKPPQSAPSKPEFLRILIVEDSEDDALLIIRELKKGGYNPVYERVETAATMKKALQEKLWNIILCDYKLPQFNAPSTIALLKETNIDIPIIIVSGTIGEETAAECMRLGAQDYIMKNNLSRLCPAIARELKEAEVRNKHKLSEQALRESEEKYRTILEDMEEGYFEINLAGDFTFVNDAECRNMGYSREELIGMNNRQYTDEENAKKAFQAFSNLYKTGESCKVFDYEVTRKDGTKAIAELLISLVKDSRGKPIGFRGLSRHITERKRMEETLRQSEEKYRAMIETIQDGYFEVDLAGNFTFVNDAQCKIVGTPREQMLGKNNRDYTSKEEAKRLYQLFSGIYRTGEPFSGFAFEFTKRDGTKAFQEVSASLIRDAQGKPIGFRGISRDVTERKLAEETLAKSEEKYRTIIETIQEGYFETDLAGRYTFANEALRRRQGYTKEELIGMSNRQFQNETDAKKAYQAFNEVYRTGEPIKALEMEVIKKDGTRGFSELSVSLIRDAQGKPIGFRGISHDVTERKKMEEALRQNEEKYRTILNSIQEGYFEFDLAGKITFINDTLWKRLGYSKEELLGHTNKVFADEATRKESFRAFNELYKTGVPVKALTQKNIRKDGSIRISELSVSLMRDSGGKPIGFFGTSRDVTERKKMEETLRESEERYRTIIETMQDGYWETDLAGRFTFINDAMYRIAESTRERLIGMSNLQYTDETTAKKLYEVFSGIYRTGEPVSEFAFEFTRRDGTRAFTELSVSLTRDAQGKPIGFRGISRDVTERKLAEETLAKSEEKYRRLVEDAQEGIYQSSVRYLALNPALARMLGYDSPEEVMSTITDISKQLYVNPDDRKKLLDMVNEKGSITDFETEYYKKDGSRIWVSINMHAVQDDQGRLLYYQGINQDITEKKKIEAERQENIERLRKSLGATINAMAVTVETRDPYTAGHQRRVADLARAIAKEINLRSDLIDGVRMASTIHDIGKMSVPSEILTKPTKLTDLEFSLIKTHSRAGYDILKDIEFPWPVANVVLQHHERMDGSGYPQGLKGDDILLEARIIAVADVVESMASHRPYRPALGIEVALEEIEKNKGILYDDTVAAACLRLFREKSYQLP